MRKVIIIIGELLFVFFAYSQKPNWQNMDLKADSVFGISTDKAYSLLLKEKKSTRVIVAIIDSGIDTLQEDLKPILWTNPKDGSHGWDFIGFETGQEDITKLVQAKKDFYDSLQYTSVPENYRAGYQAFRKLYPGLETKRFAMLALIKELDSAKKIVNRILRKMDKEQPSLDDFKNYLSEDNEERKVVNRILRRFFIYKKWKDYQYAELDNIITAAKYHLEHGLNLKNEELDNSEGDSDIMPDALGLVAEPNWTAYHGTHVAGIIGAVRNNDTGMNGIADNVQIMALKANGNIRELRDEQLAKAIRFAVDHGAKIINLSFGKPYSWNKRAVDNAVKYAMQHDVLLIHAAGNAGVDLDEEEHYPNPIYADKSGIAEAWIEVGASGYKDDSTLVASFSNYGRRSVDVFAPGVAIYSTLPFNQYAAWDGTSMAAPVVSGMAALLRSYYPRLSARQVKMIIMRSVTKVGHSVEVVDRAGSKKLVSLSDICLAGGIVNIYNAIKIAQQSKSNTY